MEHTSDIVYLGKLIGEESFSREKKELVVDQIIKIDFIGTNGIIHEIKKSDKMEPAHEFQLLYYLYYLKQKGITGIVGELNYPKLRQKKRILLTEEKEKQLEKIIADINRILSLPTPPPISVKMSVCRQCSYFELCYV